MHVAKMAGGGYVVLSADGYLLTAATDFSRANQINAIFPDGETRTFAQMELEEKKRISHRGNAIRALKAALGK